MLHNLDFAASARRHSLAAAHGRASGALNGCGPVDRLSTDLGALQSATQMLGLLQAQGHKVAALLHLVDTLAQQLS